jgi:hypothetical protein
VMSVAQILVMTSVAQVLVVMSVAQVFAIDVTTNVCLL